MSILTTPPKLRDTHVQRQALIYIRQFQPGSLALGPVL